jgi:uncharacterized protein GlcG (DUF336 family)
LADGTMRHDDDSSGHHRGITRRWRGEDDTETTLETARQELTSAAEDLERLTGELQQRTALVERLEVLSDALLDLVLVPAVVVDAEGRIVGVSRGGAAAVPELADALNKPVSAVVPRRLADEIAAFVAGPELTPAQATLLAETSTRFTALPDGSTLVVFDS